MELWEELIVFFGGLYLFYVLTQVSNRVEDLEISNKEILRKLESLENQTKDRP